MGNFDPLMGKHNPGSLPVQSCVTQWQSAELLTPRFLVRVQAQELNRKKEDSMNINFSNQVADSVIVITFCAVVFAVAAFTRSTKFQDWRFKKRISKENKDRK